MFRRSAEATAFTRRLILGALGSLTIIVVIIVTALYWFFSGDGVRVALEQQTTAWLGQPVRIGRASVSLVPRAAVRVENITVGEPVRLTLARVDLSVGLRALVSRRVEDAEVIVSGSRVDMPLPFGVPAMSAPVASAARASAAAVSGMELISIRAITLRGIVLASRGREITVSADSALTGRRLAISSLSARAGDTEITARGTVDLAPRVTAAIEATANELDVDDLLALAAAFTTNTATAPKTGTPAQFTATVTAPRARLAGVGLTRFEASMLADGTDVRIEPLEFDVFGGRFDGWLDVTFGDTLDVRVGAGVGNLDVSQLAGQGGAPNTVTGRMYGSGRFGARGRDMAAVLTAARGVGEVTISSGTIRNLDVVRTVVLFFGRPAPDTPPASGERFDSITATFALADRALRSDDLTLRSPDFDVFARGTLALPTKALDAGADLVLSEGLSAQAGRDLYRFTRAGTRIVLPAVIGGTLAQPRIRIDAGAVIRRGLGNEIERRLQDLFEQIRPPLP